MASKTLAILGAGGFVGTTLCERLFRDQSYEIRPLINSYGNAARLGRMPIQLGQVDVRDYSQVFDALTGADIVVNCSRGDELVLINGLENILRACENLGIQKLIHFSSISIYGDTPPEGAAVESEPPCPTEWYGRMKHKQDLMLHASKVPYITLCPGNIYGPYSAFVLGVAEALRKGQIALVGRSENPTNQVHVYNVVEAIVTAAESDVGWRERYFVNETEPITWKRFLGDMCRALGIDEPLSEVQNQEVLDAMVPEEEPTRTGIRDHLRIMGSGEFRDALSVLPVLKTVNQFIYRRFNKMNPRFQESIRSKIQIPTKIVEQVDGFNLRQRFIAEQVKSVFHSPQKLISTLGYSPVMNYERGFETVVEWLKFAEMASV